MVFGALIHDADHPGVSNAQLVKENAAVAITYHGNSVVEQHSVELVWTLLMEPRFVDLRTCIYSNETELQLFRQIVVNTVMATDLFDKDLNSFRKLRWEKAFGGERSVSEQATTDLRDDSNRKATIILDLILQASDVSHTMQHFTVYKKWNLCLLTNVADLCTGRTLRMVGTRVNFRFSITTSYRWPKS